MQAPVRKHVVILFCDIVGSTSLGEGADPEALRERLARYFDAVSKVIWEHGGTVEKFIGDAVMAVFGVPDTREDDAVRAVRAAGGIHQAVAQLSGLHVRIGVNSGEVFVTHQPDGQFSVTGDAVNTAQRLEAAAGTDETYVGDTVAELVRDTIVLDDVGAILHKGKTVPQQVFRVAADQDRAREVREPAFVGRSAELADLTALLERAAARREGWLLTYVGDAGIGKSRLIRQFAAGSDGGLRVVVGAADAMSTAAFAPLASWLHNLDGEWESYAEQLLGDAAAPVLQRLRSAVGLSDVQTSVEDVVWAAHTLLGALCETSPVASVWDDLHWATDAQLDFVAQLAAACRNLPVLTICLARPELFDLKPGWGGGRKSRVEDVVPLDDEDVLAIAAERIALQDGDIDIVAEDLVTRADGNPQVAQLLAQSAAAGEALPASVTQLYEAALDRLATDERSLVEAGAVFGRRFPLAPVGAIADLADAAAVVDRLRARNVLEVAGEDYRFSQAVFMQTAYRTMPKRTRITRHSALAEWIAQHREEVAADTAALVASHRVRAFELLREIDGPAAELQVLQEEAADAAMEQLVSVQLRGDPSLPEAIDTALATLPRGDERHLEVAYAAILARNSGALAERWRSWLDQLDIAMAQDATWQVVRMAPRHLIEMRTGGLTFTQARDDASGMIDRLTAMGRVDSFATELAAVCLGQADADLGNLQACHDLCVERTRAAADAGRQVPQRVWLNFDLQISYSGTTPLATVVADAQRLQVVVSGQRGLWGTTTAVLAVAFACRGRFEESRRQWSAHQRTFEGADRKETVYDLQHFHQTLAAEGRMAEAADYAAKLGRRVAAETVLASGNGYAVSLLGSAAQWALFAGDLPASRRHVADAVAIELPESLRAVHANTRAFTSAVEHALAGDRAAAVEQIAIGGSIDRPEESLAVAGYLQVITAIVEHLLGDEAASRAAAGAAKAAFDAKGAVALRDQVDTWVGNADKLRAMGNHQPVTG
nr:adenylate/guanylate cyclase domain-containing protein [Flexivirga oryzae]